jgi:hypothetical protein
MCVHMYTPYMTICMCYIYIHTHIYIYIYICYTHIYNISIFGVHLVGLGVLAEGLMKRLAVHFQDRGDVGRIHLKGEWGRRRGGGGTVGQNKF